MGTTYSADGGAHPWRTTEVRWFLPGSLPEDVRRAFLDLWPDARREPERVDRYLRLDTEALSVKLRGDLLEAKGRLYDLGLVTVGSVGGRCQHWTKWSVPSPAELLREGRPREWAPAVEIAWLAVGKERLLAHARPGTAAPSAAVELCEVRCAGQVAWTLAVEAPGPREEALSAVRDALARLGAAAPPFALSAATSLAYPAWLRGISVDSSPAGG